MDEVLLGRQFLKSIGFDLKNHLEVVSDEINKNISAKLYAASYNGMTYQSADDDLLQITCGSPWNYEDLMRVLYLFSRRCMT